MNSLPVVAVVLMGLGVIAGLWHASRPRRVFVIRVRDAKVQWRRGAVTEAFVDCVRDVAARQALRSGTIAGVAQNRSVRLEFSREVPPVVRQQLRNGFVNRQ